MPFPAVYAGQRLTAGLIRQMAPVNAYATMNRTTVQTIPDAASTLLLFTSESDDSHGGHDIGINPGRWYAPYDGRYQHSLVLPWDNNANGRRGCWFRLNGGGVLYSGASGPAGVAQSVVTLSSRPIRMTAGDYCECWVYQTAGLALNLGGINDGLVWSVDRISD